MEMSVAGEGKITPGAATLAADKGIEYAPTGEISSEATYDVYSGADIKAIIHIPPGYIKNDDPDSAEDVSVDYSKPLVLGDVQTLTYSIYREKYPVRAIGMGYPKGFCLPESAKILVKDRGYLSIRDVVEGDMVQSGPDAYNKVTAKYVQDNPKLCYKIKASDGYEIEGSYDHPVMTGTGWKQIQDIEIGEDVSVCGISPCEDKDYSVSDDMIKMLAYLIGDGTTHKYDDTYRIALSIADNEMSSIGKETKEILDRLNIPFRDNRKNDDKCISRVISVCLEGHAKTDHRKRKYNVLHKLLLEYNLYGRYSHTKKIPDKLLSKMSKKQVALFLNRLFSTDGGYCVSGDQNKYVEAKYCSTSEKLVDEIRVLLNKLGIVVLKHKENKVGKIGGRPDIVSRYDAYHLVISNCKDLVKFVNIVGIYGKQNKILSLLPMLKRRIKHNSLSICMADFKEKALEILLRRNGGRKTGAGVAKFCNKHNLYNSKLQLTPRRAYIVADELKDKVLSKYVDDIVDTLIYSDVEYIGKTVIKKDNIMEQVVYDLTVDTSESFIANFMHVHNTRGPRTISGTIIFTMFNKQVLYDVFSRIKADTSQDVSTPLIDQLPRFDITITFANEYGAVSNLVIYGVELFSEGITMSIDDYFTENVVQYLATDIRPMLPDEDSSKRLKISQRLSASDIMMQEMSDEANRESQMKGLKF